MNDVIPFPASESRDLLAKEIKSILLRIRRIVPPGISSFRTILEVGASLDQILILGEQMNAADIEQRVKERAAGLPSVLSINLVDFASLIAPDLDATGHHDRIAAEANLGGFLFTSRRGSVFFAEMPGGGLSTGHDTIDAYTNFVTWARTRLR